VNVLAATGGNTALVFVELGAIFLGLAILARFSDRIGLSPVPFYLLAGVAFGEGGIVNPAFSERFIVSAGEIGVVLLLLTLGLEYTSTELTGALRNGWVAGVVDFVANFTPGIVAGFAIGWSASSALALGGVTYVSSSGIVAKVLSDFGRLGNRETPIVLSTLVFEDLAMAVYLPVLGVVLAGASVGAGAIAVLVALGAVVLGLYVALRHGRTVSRLLNARSDEAVLLGVLGLTLLVAGAAEKLQVSAAVGAFLVGIAISGSLSERTTELVRPLRDLFAATFFFLFGLRIDPGELGPVLAGAFLLAVVTGVTKYFTGSWAARRAGIGERGQRRAGSVLIAHGEFSIVIAGLAVAAGADRDVGALCGAYVLILAAAGPIITRFADRPRPASTVAVGE
jgi:CPA2 family monovalent cation:H+ antiporter-2